MVDIFKQEICNYCKNTGCEKKELIESEEDGLRTFKCIDYLKDPSKIIPIEKPLSITAVRDYIKYFEI